MWTTEPKRHNCIRGRHTAGGVRSKEKRTRSLLVAVGELAELFDGQGLLLYVVLREQARLARHKLLDGSRYHQIINVVVGASRLPFLGWDNLGKEQPSKCVMKLWEHIINQICFACNELEVIRHHHWRQFRKI